MTDDDHYLEARAGEYTAGGRRIATEGQEPCWATYIGGHSAIFRCALPLGHDGSHESWGGTGWADPTPVPATGGTENTGAS